MTGVRRAIVGLAIAVLAGAACATKTIPPNPGEPLAETLRPNDVPRHVDDLMRELQDEMLKPVRLRMRAAPVSTSGIASDGSYTRWLTAVSESLVANEPLPKNFNTLSDNAYKDLARLGDRSLKKDAPVVDFSLLARRLHVFFEKQPLDIRKTAAAYLETMFAIAG